MLLNQVSLDFLKTDLERDFKIVIFLARIHL